MGGEILARGGECPPPPPPPPPLNETLVGICRRSKDSRDIRAVGIQGAVLDMYEPRIRKEDNYGNHQQVNGNLGNSLSSHIGQPTKFYTLALRSQTKSKSCLISCDNCRYCSSVLCRLLTTGKVEQPDETSMRGDKVSYMLINMQTESLHMIS